jgi:hypothetical protein
MAWWKALVVNVLALSGAAGFTVVALRGWLDRRQQLGWPLVLATVTAYKQGPGVKGRSATYLIGHYPSSDHGTSEFTVEWDISDLESGAWVPPPGTPPLGSTIRLHVDPRNPSAVALPEGPRVRTASGTFRDIALVDVTLLACAIAVWFI